MITKEKIKEICNNPKNQALVDVGLFFVLIFSFHILYVIWNEYMDYCPIKGTIDKLFAWASALLFDQSTWVLDRIFKFDFVTQGQSIYFMNNEDAYSCVTVAPECTSLKQWMHWLFLMLLFPGPWKHKAWYIPLGLVIVEFTNVVRIVGICLFLKPFPHDFALAHDVIFKIMFYVVIFLMWMVWNDCFHHPRTKKVNPNPSQQ